VTQAVVVSDDRRVTFDWSGDIDGFPVFLLHGTPGSRSGPRPRASVLYRLGVRLICYDRPGYGESDRHKGRSVADAAWDVLAIADELKLKEFGVVGRSGGGPHALACAALLGQRPTITAVLVSLAPSDADGLDWHRGMTGSNVSEYKRADSCPEEVEADLTERAGQIRDDPESLLAFLADELTAPDRKVVSDVSIRRQLHDTYKQAVRVGAYGWIDDVLAFRRPWGFDLEKITNPVLLWHGDEDVFSPPSHTDWLARKIPGAKVDIQRGAAHFDAVRFLPKILARMKASEGKSNGTAAGRSERLGVEDPDEAAVAAERRDAGVFRAEERGELGDDRVPLGPGRLVTALRPGEQQVRAAAQRVGVSGSEHAD
jgi:pimeloyl-ACP methyl ester carboxylesterase